MKLLTKLAIPSLVLMAGLFLSHHRVSAQESGSSSLTPAKTQQQTPTPSSSTIGDNICRGIIGTETGTVNRSITVNDCAESESESFGGLVRRIINIFSIVVGSVSVIMIIIGGFRYIISGGDSAGVSAAKNTILYAIVGLVIVLFSQIIIRFVISNFKPS